MDKNKIQEEVTITPIIRDIERLFIKLFQLIGFLFNSIGDVLFYIFKTIVRKPKLFLLLSLAGVAFSLLSFLVIKESRKSSLTIALNVDAKVQLENDINYFNSLVKKDQYEVISALFSLTIEEAESIKKVEIKPYVSFINQLEIYDDIYKKLDTNVRKNLDFNSSLITDNVEFLTNRFIISVIATDGNIFSKIEAPLMKFLERVPELNEMRIERKLALNYELSVLKKELTDLDTLKKVFNQSLIIQAKNGKSSEPGTTIKFGKADENDNFTVLDIHREYLDQSKRISDIQTNLGRMDTCYTVHSHFNSFGEKKGLGTGWRIVVGFFGGILLGFLSLSTKSLLQKIED